MTSPMTPSTAPASRAARASSPAKRQPEVVGAVEPPAGGAARGPARDHVAAGAPHRGVGGVELAQRREAAPVGAGEPVGMLAPPACSSPTWLKTPSRMSPSPRARQAATSRSNAASPPNAGIDAVEVGRVVLVRRRRGEDGRQVDGVGAQGGDVVEVGADAVDPAEGADEDLIDDPGATRHGALLTRRAENGRRSRRSNAHFCSQNWTFFTLRDRRHIV